MKGFDLAVEAAKRIGVDLRCVQKGESQIPHADMKSGFYGQIDVLVHPVGPGREGTSNVIMEALAVGLPVITTRHAGFHAEMLTHGANVMFVERDVEEIAAALQLLRNDPELRAKLGAGARDFAAKNHNLENVALEYDRVIRDALYFSRGQKREVSFLPFWKPAEQFGSSRLRALYPSELLNAKDAGVKARLAEAPGAAEISVVVQSAEDPTIGALNSEPSSFTIYDCCDRYFEEEKLFATPSGKVNSLSRFRELADRADALIAPTRELKAELSLRLPHKPCFHIPEPIDYGQSLLPPTQTREKVVVWFGNPHRGNFESSKWVLDLLVNEMGYRPRIISKRSFFKKHPEYEPHCVEWDFDDFPNELREARICVVSHASDEPTKSPNRLVAAVARGVPTIVANSAACAEILEEAGCDYAVVSSPEDLARAVQILETPEGRAAYISQVQRVIESQFGVSAVRRAYLDLFLRKVPAGVARRPRVAFVSHNLKIGEGAPRSLFELATGLSAAGLVEPHVYCPCMAELGVEYEQAGIPVHWFSDTAKNPQKVLDRAFETVRKHFIGFLRREQIDVVVANTIRAAPFADFAARCGIPSVLIIRESFEQEERFRTFSAEGKSAAERGLVGASTVVFVSGQTQRLWSDQPMAADVRVIPNGINRDKFAADLDLATEDARRELGLPADQVIALCVGSISLRKGQFELLEQIRNLPDAVKERLTVVFVGATESILSATFREKLGELGPTSDKIRVIDVTPEVGKYYRAASFLLVNSKSESYPRAVMEGLLFGLPVAATPVYGVLDQITHGKNGFIYDYEDWDGWRRYVSQLVTDELLRKKMSQAAARSFWKLTTHAEMLHSYRCVIEDAFKSPAVTKEITANAQPREAPATEIPAAAGHGGEI
jgi:glycosyltransferase involved in cell wall biosynthesis